MPPSAAPRLALLAVLLALVAAAADAAEDARNRRQFPVHIPLGVLDPEAELQRYRGHEWPTTRPFFQWWYVWLRDEQAGEHVALCISMSRCAVEKETDAGCVQRQGSYSLFANFGQDDGFRLARYERHPIGAFVADKHTQRAAIVGANGPQSPAVSIEAADEAGNVVTMAGLADESATWRTQGCDAGACAGASYNLTFYRDLGWYGQEQPIEEMSKLVGALQVSNVARCRALILTR